MSKCVLITGIGGNVGQGIVRNILSFGYNVKIIGTDIEAVTGGNHLCDKVHKVPFSTAPGYISSIVKICKKEKVDMIIPSTDYEIYFLAKAVDKLPLLASSDEDTAYIFLNKYKTWLEFKKLSIPFAETTLPSLYNNEFEEIIVKPIEGRGSRGIHFNPAHPKEFSDNFIIQKLYKGTEITTAFYVTKQKRLLGHITLEKTVFHGVTKLCEVIFDYDKKIEKIIKKIVKNFRIKGSCNIQSIVDEKDNIIPFEINCRLSGTNSIRGHFGFEDVRYTLDEYLFNKRPKRPIVKKGAAVRLLMDVIYSGVGLKKIKDKTTAHHMF